MADDNTESSDTSEFSSIKKSEEFADYMQNKELPYSLDATRMCSPNVLSTPRLKSSFSFTSKAIDLKSNILESSQHNGNANLAKSTPAFILNPSKLNPFSKTPQSEDVKTNVKSEFSPKFLPLVQNGTKSESKCEVSENKQLPSTSQSNFVFGQNIEDRVVSDKPKCDVINANGTTESQMLFTAAVKDTSGISAKPVNSKTLSESAREYEESRAIKRKYDEVEIKTGEEEETNVLQISCKLFTFDKNGGGTWQERGRGTLRLNDQQVLEKIDHRRSRLVFRTSGSLRVILNTKVWGEMAVQLASNKSIRFTAFDSNGEIKVFLVTGSPDDIKQLHRHLETRVNKEIEYQKCKDGDETVLTEPDRKKLSTTNE